MKRQRKTTSGIPGHYKRGPSTVEVDLGLGKPQEGGVASKATYTISTERIDSRYQLHLTWMLVDAHRGTVTASGVLDLPHAVLERILAQREGIVAQARKDGAQAGYRTRTANAKAEGRVLEPFKRKEA